MATDKTKGSWQLRKFVIRFSLAAFLIGVGRRRKQKAKCARSKGGLHLLLTGTFYSQNWINSQLQPFALVEGIAKVTFVSSIPISDIDGVNVVYPSRILQKTIGSVAARLCTFFWYGIRQRPDVVGGYHLLVNGLVALLIAKITRAISLYICVGGPTEILGGGYSTENRIFGRLSRPDPKIESQLLSAVSAFDWVVVRGHSAKSYFEKRNIASGIRVITAGVDAAVFSPSNTRPDYDLVFLARLSVVKRVEIFLEIVDLLNRNREHKISALIIGDGPTRQIAEKLIEEKGLEEKVCMIGQQDEIAGLLNRARVFVLTSKSEGLSQAMVQAMLCGLPAVVANVGALADLVTDNLSGHLIDDHGAASAYAGPIETLLRDSGKLKEMGTEARQSALSCSVENVAGKWAALVSEIT